MKIFFLSSVTCLYLVVCGFAQSSLPVEVRVLKDNTNLRARPARNVEVAGQVSADQKLVVKSMDAEWVEVVPPTNVDLWVLGDYLKDGVVVCRQAVNVRAGPGINFSIVGQLTNNFCAEVRGSHAEWIKIKPPAMCSLWVARSLVDFVPPAPVTPPVVEPATPARPEESVSAGKTAQTVAKKPKEQTAPSAAPVPAAKPDDYSMEKTGALLTKPPTDLDLTPNIIQGQQRQFEGVLKTKSFLVRSPADFRLVMEDQDGRSRTVCFVKGNHKQLNALLFREMVISGRQYWVYRQRYPVIVPEKITLK